MHIIYCADKKVVPGLHVAVYSLLDNISTEPIITIFSDSLNNDDIELLHKSLQKLNKPYQLYLHTIDTNIFSEFPTLNSSYATYFRLYAANIVDAERVLYIDVDTLCDVDVFPLQSLDMGTKPVAWLPESPLDQSIDPEVAKVLGNKPVDWYYNAGVLLIDLNNWRNQNISSLAMDYIATRQPAYHDQSALNVILHNNSIDLDKKYNLISNGRKNWSNLKSSYGNINSLIHFLDYPKPWNYLSEFFHPQFRLWKSVLDLTAYKNFHSWRYASITDCFKSGKEVINYKKSIKDKILFSAYKKGMLKKIKGI